jgi:hypothetical protein
LPAAPSSRRSVFDWVFAVLVLLGTGFAFWRYHASMDVYEQGVLLGAAPSLIALGWFWSPLRTLSLIVGAAALLAIGLYGGHRDQFGADLAVATTGYAEPSVADGVVSPMAWWAIAHRRRGRVVKILSGRVECPGERRVAVQQIVAGAVLAELAAYLRVWRRSR